MIAQTAKMQRALRQFAQFLLVFLALLVSESRGGFSSNLKHAYFLDTSSSLSSEQTENVSSTDLHAHESSFLQSRIQDPSSIVDTMDPRIQV
jgi:hypothetical protein